LRGVEDGQVPGQARRNHAARLVRFGVGARVAGALPCVRFHAAMPRRLLRCTASASPTDHQAASTTTTGALESTSPKPPTPTNTEYSRHPQCAPASPSGDSVRVWPLLHPPRLFSVVVRKPAREGYPAQPLTTDTQRLSHAAPVQVYAGIDKHVGRGALDRPAVASSHHRATAGTDVRVAR